MSLLSVTLTMTVSALVFLHQYECQIYVTTQNEDPNHPGKCVYKNQPHDVGSEWTEPGCQRGSCHKNQDGKYNLAVAGCGLIGLPPGCTAVSNDTLPYPDCCPKPKCNF